MNVCKIDDCGRQIVDRKLQCCLMHYKRFRKNGNFQKWVREKVYRKCGVEECNKGYHSLGYCQTHYLTFKKYNDPTINDKKRDERRKSKKGYAPRIKGRANHTYIMEQHLKRELKKGELVHHIDLNKRNDEINNLYLCSRSQHAFIHKQLERVAGEMVRQGVIGFSKGKYYLKKNSAKTQHVIN